MTGEADQRRILALVTTGGFTHAAPVLDVCQDLARRGHTIQFATLQGQESWTKNYPFIQTVHTLGPGVTEEQQQGHYGRMLKYDTKNGIGSGMWESKYLWDSFWPTIYQHLKAICQDPETRPDFIFADFFAELAAKDMMAELGIPVAIMWPQMPFLLAPASYIPGQPGFQVDVMPTSERASLMSRMRNELVVFWAVPSFTMWLWWLTGVRRRAGAKYPNPMRLSNGARPYSLTLVNSFFGLEAPKDLPPLIAAVGPILADEFPDLDDQHRSFLETHDRTVYVALGTHVILPTDAFMKLLLGLLEAMAAGHINGVIWSLPQATHKTLDLTLELTVSDESRRLSQLLDNQISALFFPNFSPQRAVLEHNHTKLFVTHAGGSSANEVVFHGVPVLVIPFMFDQLGNSVRLQEAGVGLGLDKFLFTSRHVSDKIVAILEDREGNFSRNVQRMKKIARIAAKRKHLAADLIEEVMYDDELRRAGGQKRPMHLETADVRMTWFKARNWDLRLFALASFVGVPAAVALSVHPLFKDRNNIPTVSLVSGWCLASKDLFFRIWPALQQVALRA